ncbi:MAG TPA: glycosyltransferase [Bacteroidales bacterium]|nr:glycosyltransferase [Bacteroidales bacterium]
MKITIIGTAYPYRGGLAAYNERLAREFVTEGHNVTIVTFSLQYPSFLFPGKSQYLDGPAPEELNIRREVNSVNPFNWISTGRRIKKQNPDILIFKYWLPFMAPCFGTIARIVRKNRHTKVITIFDNVIPHERHPGDRLLTRYYTSAIDGAIAMSASVLNDLAEFRNDIPARLNPHPLFDNFGSPVDRDKALGQLGLDPSFSYILFFGFIRKYKGLDLLIEAFSNEQLRNRNLKLIVAGEFYEDGSQYRELVDKFNLEKEIIFFDRFINDNEVAAFFSIADLIVQPYRSATQSGVTQIAYHFGKPMLVTDVGGLREIVPDHKCGYVVNPEPESISSAISDFFINNRKEEFTGNVLAEREKYTWAKMTASIKEVYTKCSNYDYTK